MPRIAKLSQEVYNRIAAGEVITSPAAVVKELVENSLDAGAAAVTVEIQEGGRDLIRVSDNGCGMGREDLALSIEKHATSKIDSFDDLYALSSLGFRGEALASIAEVSKLSIASREKDAQSGNELHAESGKVDIREAGLPEGTSIKVEDIFFNIPARRKHMRSAAKEGAAVTETVKRLILSRPQIAFKYIRNGHIVYQTPGDGDLKKAAAVIYGPDILRSVVEVEYAGSAAAVRGIVSKPTYIFKTASRIELFLNGRYIQSKELVRAVESGYKGSILHGHHPQAILHIDVDPATVDINIHPSKISALLFSEEDVMRDVSRAVSDAVLHEVEPPALPLQSRGPDSEDVDMDALRQPGFWQVVPPGTTLQQAAAAAGQNRQGKKPEPLRPQKAPEAPVHAPIQSTDLSKEDTYAAEPFTQEFESVAPAPHEDPVQEHAADIRSLKSYRILGTAFSTYIFCEAGEYLYVIDQHAAQERLTYEQLLKNAEGGQTYTQLLLIPIVRTFSADEYALLTEYSDLLGTLGISFEPFGELTLRFFGFPVEMDNVDRFLDSLLNELRTYGKEAVVAREKIISSACRHSVKAGADLTKEEIERLLEEITSMSAIPHCPHGRPIAVTISRKDLEKGFKRQV